MRNVADQPPIYGQINRVGFDHDANQRFRFHRRMTHDMKAGHAIGQNAGSALHPRHGGEGFVIGAGSGSRRLG